MFAFVALGLYIVAIQTSVAAMETLGPILWVTGMTYAIKNRKFTLPSRLLTIAMLGLILTATLSFFINDVKSRLFINYLGEFRWMITFLGFIQFFNVFKDRMNWNLIIKIGQFTAVVTSLYAVYQLFYGHDFFRPQRAFHQLYANSVHFRPNGFFNMPTTYAHSSSMFFAFCLPFLMGSQPSSTFPKKALERLYFLITPITIFMTFTRAAWAASIAWALSYIYKNHTSLMKRTLITLTVILAFAYFGIETFQDRLNSIFDMSYEGNSHRLYLWKANWFMFLDHPLWGIGYEADLKREVVHSYLNTFAPDSAMRGHPHSTYLNYLSGLGIFGFIFFMLFLASNIKNSVDGIKLSKTLFERHLFWGVLGAQIIVLIGSFTECMLEDIEINHQYIFYVALQQVFLNHLKDKADPLNSKQLSENNNK